LEHNFITNFVHSSGIQLLYLYIYKIVSNEEKTKFVITYIHYS